jgi:hypothetical protein
MAIITLPKQHKTKQKNSLHRLSEVCRGSSLEWGVHSANVCGDVFLKSF